MSLAGRLTFANVMSVIAVFIALGGTVYGASGLTGKTIKKNSEPGNRIKKNSLTGKQIKESSLGTVPDASKLGGKGPGSFASAGLEAPHVVGTSGQPAYTNGWAPNGVNVGASFYKDPYGIVHLDGFVGNTTPTSNSLFTLPAGYRPADTLSFAVKGSGANATTIEIGPDGSIDPFSAGADAISLSGVTFRAGG